jgi:hypothetical protein
MTTKTKLTVEKVINKSFIVWGVRKNDDAKIYCKWSLSNSQYNEIYNLSEFIFVDYDKNKREWYVTYVINDKILSCTIDDISSSYSTSIF